MRAFIESVSDFGRLWKPLLINAIPAALGLLLLIFISRPTYLAMGGLFLRTSDILAANPLDLLISLVAVLLSLALFTLSFVLIAAHVKAKRTMSSLSFKLLEERFLENSFAVGLVFTLFFAFSFLIQVFSLVVNHLVLLHLFSFLVFMTFLFVPFSVVIDNYSLSLAINKSLSLIQRKPSLPLIWFAVLFSLFVIEHAFSLLLFGYGIGSYISFLIVAFILLPFSVIFGAHLYMDRYPLS